MSVDDSSWIFTVATYPNKELIRLPPIVTRQPMWTMMVGVLSLLQRYIVQQIILTARSPKAIRTTRFKAGKGVERNVVGMRIAARSPKRTRVKIFDERNRNKFFKRISDSEDFLRELYFDFSLSR